MALTPTQEAQVLQLIAQEAALLSLAGNEPTITSKLGATKVNLSQLTPANVSADADLFLTRQGSLDKSISALILRAYNWASPVFTGTPPSSASVATLGSQLPQFGQLTPMASFTRVTGTNTTATANVSFLVPSKGILLAWGNRNMSTADASGNDMVLTLQGVAVANDNTKESASFVGKSIMTGPGTAAASCAGVGINAFSVSCMLLFIPTA